MSELSQHPMAALKAAIRTHLLNDPGLSGALSGQIYDAPPRAIAPPYLVIGDGLARENDTNDAKGEIIDLDLSVFTNERGAGEGLALAQAIRNRLESAPPIPTPYRLVLQVLRETQSRFEPKAELNRVTLRWRFFLEAN
jgi:Protein of unknown function (DUF3168)